MDGVLEEKIVYDALSWNVYYSVKKIKREGYVFIAITKFGFKDLTQYTETTIAFPIQTWNLLRHIK